MRPAERPPDHSSDWRPDVPLQRSVATRGFLAVAGFFVPVIIAVLTIAVVRDYRHGLDNLESHATSQARFLATVSPEAVFSRDFLALETLVRQAVEDPSTVHVVFIDNSESSMTRYVDRGAPLVQAAPDASVSHDSAVVADRLASEPFVKEIRWPIISEGVQLGEVRLSYSVESARTDAQGFAIAATIVAIAVAGMVTAITLLVFHRWVRRPLRRLTARTQAVAAGRFDDDVVVDRDDEIGVLERSFNEMAIQLQGTLAGLERARDDAEAANRAKSEFLANVSHEVRTPLNAVLGLGELLLDSDLTDDQRESLTTMQRSGGLLLETLNEILEFSKLENGTFQLDTEPFDVRGLVDATVEMFSGAAEVKGISLTLDVVDDVPVHVAGHAGCVRQILANLIGNAVKFTDRGSVSVKVSPRPDDAGHLRFSVADTGIGIDPERADALFEPFRQADNTTTRVYGGTGLGLSISQRIVYEMGGSIAATGQVGVGATFSFELPLPEVSVDLADEPGRPVADIPVDLGRTHPLRILLAEDNQVNQMVATRTLQRLGYGIDLAEDGVEAVEMVLHSQYDLVLMDIQMPRLDGVQAAERIHSLLPDGRRPRLIAFTAHVPDGDPSEFMAATMDGYLSKPIEMEALIGVLRTTPELASHPERPDHTGSPDENVGEPDAGPLDRGRLRELLGDDADLVVADLLPVFVADAEQQLDVIRAAVSSGDLGAVRRAAHSMKGSSRSLAAIEFAAVCECLESLAHEGNRDRIEDLVLDLDAELRLITRLVPAHDSTEESEACALGLS